MKTTKRPVHVILLAMLTLFCSIPSRADVKPQWVRHGEETMNRKRISKDYVFKVFHTWNADLGWLEDNRFEPLKEYLAGEYGASPMTMKIDSVVNAVSGKDVTTYIVSFPDGNHVAKVYAQRADVYVTFDDYVTNEYGFEYYQLYAVSAKDHLPVFDSFEAVQCDNTKALAYSIVPGAGQFYKGDNFKGAAIIGSEAVLAVAAVLGQVKKNYSADKVAAGIPNVDSWKSKEISWKGVRNISLSAMGVIYLFNLIDAASGEGSSRVNVKKSEGKQLSVEPSSHLAGASLVFRF